MAVKSPPSALESQLPPQDEIISTMLVVRGIGFARYSELETVTVMVKTVKAGGTTSAPLVLQ
jgi:hypothetical protein